MRSFATLLAGAASLFAAIAAAAPAHAIPRTFVSGTGGGAACTRAAPCANFQAAHDVTDPGGEINCIDAGEFGRLIVTKNITVDCAGTLGGALATSSGVTVNAAGIIVRLRNLTIIGNAASSNSGISFLLGSTLFVENCTISNVPGAGIAFGPPDGITGKLFVTNTVIAKSGSDAIAIQGDARAIIEHVRMEKNARALVAQAQTGALVVVQIRDSVATGNIDGITASNFGTATSVTIDRSSMTLNSANGLTSHVSGAFILVGRSAAIGNGTGLVPNAGGSILSYQNNHLTGNFSDGAPTGVLTMR
jgi:hypothetical protein